MPIRIAGSAKVLWKCGVKVSPSRPQDRFAAARDSEPEARSPAGKEKR
jgi:hypothetical protein